MIVEGVVLQHTLLWSNALITLSEHVRGAWLLLLHIPFKELQRGYLQQVRRRLLLNLFSSE